MTYPLRQAYVSSGINACVSAFVCLHFALSDTGGLNSLDMLCITRVPTVIFLCQNVHPPAGEGSVYVVIHKQTVSLYHNSSVWLDTRDVYLYLYIYSKPGKSQGILSHVPVNPKSFFYWLHLNYSASVRYIFK